MKIKCNFCGKKFNKSFLRKIKALNNYTLYICKDCFLKVRSED